MLYRKKKINEEEENEGRSRTVMCDKDREKTEQI